MAPDISGLPERICTLTGSRQSIEKAKELNTAIINRGGPPLPTVDTNHVPDGHTVVEMMIPGHKVGLVIGKGGETIRNLQKRAAVKMVLIQDGPQQTSQEKPLRIMGEPDKCEYAKQLVMDLITEKQLEQIPIFPIIFWKNVAARPDGSAAGGQRPGGDSGNTHETFPWDYYSNMVSRNRYTIGKVAAGATLGFGGATIALPALGFSTAGVAAGSVAAGVQAIIGNVAAGSAFAVLQSTGAAGMAFATKAVLATVGGYIASKL